MDIACDQCVSGYGKGSIEALAMVEVLQGSGVKTKFEKTTVPSMSWSVYIERSIWSVVVNVVVFTDIT